MLNVSKLETFLDNKAAMGDDLALYRASNRLEELGAAYQGAADACRSRAMAVEYRRRGMVDTAIRCERDSEMTLGMLR